MVPRVIWTSPTGSCLPFEPRYPVTLKAFYLDRQACLWNPEGDNQQPNIQQLEYAPGFLLTGICLQIAIYNRISTINMLEELVKSTGE